MNAVKSRGVEGRGGEEPPAPVAPETERPLLEFGLLDVRLLASRNLRNAFSLIEVVAAVAIFAVGMVAMLGLFAPVTKSVATVGDAEAAARVADAVRARLAALPFDTAVSLIQTPGNVRKNDGDGAYNPNDGTKHPYVLFGKLNGEVGVYDRAEVRPNWRDANNQIVANADKFFEIDLIRNETLSPLPKAPAEGEGPVVAPAPVPFVAYTIRVRWPAFIPQPAGGAVQVGANPGAGGPVPFDHSRKQVLFFTGVIRR